MYSDAYASLHVYWNVVNVVNNSAEPPLYTLTGDAAHAHRVLRPPCRHVDKTENMWYRAHRQKGTCSHSLLSTRCICAGGCEVTERRFKAFWPMNAQSSMRSCASWPLPHSRRRKAMSIACRSSHVLLGVLAEQDELSQVCASEIEARPARCQVRLGRIANRCQGGPH